MAYCYIQLGKFDEAEQNFIFLKNMQPHWLLPRVSLLQVYQHQKDGVKSISMAREILSIVPKITNERSAAYQRYARDVLNKYNSKPPRQQMHF